MTTDTSPVPTVAPCLDAVSARALLADNPAVLLVDVRTPAEFETAHIAGAVNLPLDQVDAHLDRIVRNAGGQLILVCQSGNRAGQACTKLSSAGVTTTNVLTGGMNAWIAAGGAVERGRERWSLERQVRLVAGAIVLISVVASWWLPGLRYVAGVVGAGLAFAALSNTCAMGSLLSRLPYNRGAGCDIDAAITRLRDADTGSSAAPHRARHRTATPSGGGLPYAGVPPSNPSAAAAQASTDHCLSPGV